MRRQQTHSMFHSQLQIRNWSCPIRLMSGHSRTSSIPSVCSPLPTLRAIPTSVSLSIFEIVSHWLILECRSHTLPRNLSCLGSGVNASEILVHAKIADATKVPGRFL